jgi:glycerol uptake facilitator-like aquaporin
MGRRAVAEFVGTFTLVFIGVGSIVAGVTGGIVGVALAHGLAIALMVSAVGTHLGRALQPRSDAGFLVTRRIEPNLRPLAPVSRRA